MKLAGKLDLAIGIALGLIVGLALAYLVVFEIGGGNSGSSITNETTTTGAETTRTAPASGVLRRPAQRR